MKVLKHFTTVVMALLMAAGTFSLTSCAQGTESTVAGTNSTDIIIPYKDVAHGQVDRKPYSVVEKTSDNEKGTVYKVVPNLEASEDGKVNIDAWSLDKYKVNLNEYKTLKVEYKYTSKGDTSYTPAISVGNNGGKTLKNWKSVFAMSKLEKDKWTTAVFDLTKVTKNNIGTDGILWQMHFYPFGNAHSCKEMKNGEEILIGNLIFTQGEAKEGEAVLMSSVNITFTYNNSEIADPAAVSAKPGEVITLPETGAEKDGKHVTKWFCETENSYYDGKARFTVPNKNVSFVAFWESVNAPILPIKISYADYSGGICNRVDTATTETVSYEGKKSVKVVPNPQSSNGGAINLDGWTYSGAKVDVTKYNTAILVYKYLSEKPVDGKSRMIILRWNEFSGQTSMDSRENIVAGKWAAASYDMTGAKNKAIDGKIPNITQMHIYPLGAANKVGIMDSNDALYVADIIFIPEVTKSASYNASYIGGYDDGTFKPNGTMTRAEACTVLARLMADGDENVSSETTSSFTDVASDEWYAKYISACERAGLLSSYSGTFLPNQNITRAEFVELVYKMDLLKDAGKNGSFTDVPESYERYEVIRAAGASGLISGYPNGDGTYSFKPDNTITRTEVVKVINNALGRSANIEAIKGSGYKNGFADVDENFWGYAEIVSAANTHIAYITHSGKETWLPMATGLDESDFKPDYEAAIKKASEVDALMVKRIEEIRNTPDTLKPSGKRIYVSNNGSDDNDGLSEGKAVATVEAAQKLASAGDAILFERGGEWRVNFTAISGVSYGAYGKGAKPIINGNTTGNAADPSLWTLVPGSSNVYVFKETLRDVGNIIYNDGSIYTDKLVPSINDSLELCTNGVKYDPLTSHTKNNTFFMVYDEITGKTLNMSKATGKLYLRCDEGNPGEVYERIEIASYGHAIVAKSDNTFENLCIMYAGGHGITAGTCKNLVIRNCEIGWIGGTSQYMSNGKNTRYGNGIQIYGGSDGFTIDNCYVYECYDAGISPQYSAYGSDEILLENIFYTNNVIDKCIYNIEYFMGAVESGNAERHFKTMHFIGNILARSGYGWGMGPSRSACIKGWDHYNKASDFIIKDNIILNPAYNAYHIGADFEGWLPEFSGNTYIIRRNSQFVKYGANGSPQYTFNSTADETARNALGEENYTLYYLPEDYVTPEGK